MESAQSQRLVQLMSAGFLLGLIVWGIYTLLYYVGVPVHIGVLLDGGAKDMVMGACPEDDAFLCRGLYGFLPFVAHTIVRAASFVWYGALCIGVYGGFVAWRWFQTGETALTLRMRPWKVCLAFAISLWLLFTTLSFTNNGNHPFNWLFEPLPQVYVGATEGGLDALKENMANLEERGCLKLLGKTTHGARVFRYKQSCVQMGFWTIVVPQILFSIFLIFDFLVLGRWLLQLFRLRTISLLLESATSIGLGIFGWIGIIWFLAVISQITPVSLLSAPITWILLIAVPVAAYPQSCYWVRKFLREEWHVQCSWYSLNILLGWLLLSYLALNFLTVIRPFPIGWDDLGSYLNRPKLMVSYGHFIFSMSAFQWEYLTSLGYLLFGYESVFGTTAAMVINWMAGLFATVAVFVFARTFLGAGSGLLSALLYYSLPVIGHFSFADMKIDNAVFLMGVLSALMLFVFLFYHEGGGEGHRPWGLLILAGLFGGLSFGMKPTGIMVLMALGAILLAVELHWLAFIASVFFAFGVFAYQGQLYLGRITEKIFGENLEWSQKGFAALCIVFGLLFLVGAWMRRRDRIMPTSKAVGLFVGGFLLSIYPWVFHNNIQGGATFPLIPGLTLSAPNKISPYLTIRTIVEHPAPRELTLPEDLRINPDDPTCKETGHREELDRYWGFGNGWGHYLTLPWRTVMNLDSAGYYVTTIPALLLFPLVFLLPYLWWTHGRWIRWLSFGTLFMIFQWMFMASGILWYGIGMFLGICIGLEVLSRRAPDVLSRTLTGVLIVCSLFVAFANRFWQYEQQLNLLEYPFGKVSEYAMRERTIPHYDNIARYVTERHEKIPDRPYLYRVGTFIPYFIPRNLEVIGIVDHQLDQFNCLHQERNPKITVARLKALGFNSIIFDTNTATIERNDGTLHKKVQAFVDFLNSPEAGLQPVVNDPGRGVAYVLIP